MKDKERLIRALNSLTESGEKRIAQQEAEREEDACKNQSMGSDKQDLFQLLS